MSFRPKPVDPAILAALRGGSTYPISTLRGWGLI